MLEKMKEIVAEQLSCDASEVELSTKDSKIPVWMVPTNEELAICRETVALVK